MQLVLHVQIFLLFVPCGLKWINELFCICSINIIGYALLIFIINYIYIFDIILSKPSSS